MPRRIREPEVQASYLLSVVIPTRNERRSVPLLVPRLSQVLAGVSYEVIFVDDSDDDTVQLIQRSAAENGLNIAVIHRDEEARWGGLSTAVMEGFGKARGEYVCVMDADLQHPPDLIIPLLSLAEDSAADIVIASRYVEGGSAGGLRGFSRKLISWAAKWLVKVLFYRRLRSISDPCSGYFLARRALLQEVSLRPIGFKILLDILVRCSWSRAKELPLRFAPRVAGASKASLKQGRDFLVQSLGLFWHVRFDGLVRRIRRFADRERH